MSQAGDVDITGTHPDIATDFVTDSGTAVPILNTIEILGTYVAAGTTPVETTGSGNTVTVEVQISQAIAATDVTKIGLSNFSSAAFSVDANGFVTLNGGGGAATNIDVDAHTAPGTDPVVPNAGNIIMTGAQVASGVVGANVIRTDSLAANTVTIEIQRSAAVAATDSTKNGVAHFDSGSFAVDANGFVTLAGGGLAIDSIGTQTGTNPIAPTAAGLVTINGAVVAAGTNPVRSDGTGANTMALEVQISQALAATDATKIGLSNFDSAAFDVDANGFVQLNGGGIATTSFDVQANTAPGTDPVVPTAAGVVTVNGAVVANHSVVLETRSRAANAYNLEVQYATSAAATDGTKSGVAHFDSAAFTVDASGFVQLAGGGLAIDSIGVDATSGGGTNPVLPTVAGLVTVNGAVVAAGTTPIRTVSTAANVYQIQAQTSQAVAAADATKIGLSNFDSASFTVDASGFVKASATGLLKTLSDDVATVVNPALGNIQLVGHVNEQGATKFSTVTAGVNLLNINPMSASRWIVDTLGFNGTHTTIQAAITAATSGDNVFILEGVYTENLTLKAGVNLVGYRGSGRTSTVTILGNCTFATLGTATISGCKLQTNGSFCISNTGANASILNIIDCDIQAANNTAINYTNSNAASQIFISICTMNIGATGNALHTMSSIGTLQYRYCNISNTGASVTVSSNSAGKVIFYFCNIFCPLSTSATGIIEKRYSYVDTSAQNVTCLTTAGTGTVEIDFGGDASGTATAIVVGSGTTVFLNSSDIYTSNAAAISGAGTLNFSLLTFEGTSSAITTTTQVPRAVSNNAVVLKTPGAYPYTTIPQDAVILVDTSAARTITPLANPTTGQMHRIKDNVGSAATNAITITPSGKNIDGLASRTINSNWGSIDICYNGTQWNIL